MIFLDTSAIYALADADDPRHGQAVVVFRRLLDGGDGLLVHNYVLVESVALLQRRLGTEIALQFLDQSTSFRTHWVSASDHRKATDLFRERGQRRLSLVDCVSFVVMRRYGVTHALAFDEDFEKEGFRLYSS